MNIYTSVLQLLHKKQYIMAELEQETQTLIVGDYEELENCISRRQTLLDNLAKLDLEISKISQENSEINNIITLKDIVDTKSEYLTELLKVVLSIQASVNRIKNMDLSVIQRFEFEKQIISKKIEKINKNSAKALKKYRL